MEKMSKTSSDGSGSYTIHIEKNLGLEGESPLAIHDLQMVAREGISLLGGPAAILLQIAHPKVGQGVADHSTFASRAISRAQYTQMYIYVMIFGSVDEKAAMKAWVDKAHSRVKGGSGEKGSPKYDATDPELQLWVAATIYASMVASYEIIYGPLPPARAERVYQAYSCMGTSLQVPREMWPKNLRAFRKYWDDMINNQLQVTPDARKVLAAAEYSGAVLFEVDEDVAHDYGVGDLDGVVVLSLYAVVYEAGAEDVFVEVGEEENGQEGGAID
ncbi:hypothetical protein FE257_005382 [Aspergillus nanangensis]|uniref:ER-bound oxygenase mpaB/mpaB'/Rubber oxygenase catalytic domain-containing protein n=1 Tax=Aspergillus nanangensis TaxID=2582783 RepID=A0AAD4CQN2_ASPNN|nr:hypothetical protein FE257_005382 [Aspergillus nanangensis]